MRLLTRRQTKAGVVAGVLIASASLQAQSSAPEWPRVQMEFFLTNTKGELLPIPDVSAFALKENGSPQTLGPITPLAGPQSVCLLMDTSGSMFDSRQLVLSAATRFLQGLPPEDEVCLATFSWAFHLVQRFTGDRAVAIAALQHGLQASGGTAMYDSIDALARYMSTAVANPSRAILIITDGADNASRQISLEQLRAHLEALGNPALHILSVPNHGIDSRTQRAHDEHTLTRLSSFGAGNPYFPRNDAECQAAIDDLLQTTHARFLLSYTSSNPLKDGSERRIEVGIDKQHGGNKIRVHAPEGYYAPAN